jgi:ubiquinone/menaquinone biosynthesis C-methylase UbiE
MAEPQIKFEDGAGYENMMGVWSRFAGDVFLDWLALPKGLRCVDVGCGNGAFTELLVERCAPSDVQGIDPSPGQLAFARQRHTAGVATFREGDAMALPFADKTFDIATMALVIFFVPDPPKGIAEMKRVVRSGGTIAAYAWDLPGGGFPLEPLLTEIRAMGYKVPQPPSAEASRITAMHDLWSGAGLASVQTREIVVERTYRDFNEFWTSSMASPSVTAALAAMPAANVEQLKDRVRGKLPTDAAGRITYGARANAAKGRVP